MLRLENINASYGYLQILWDISLEINRGEVVAVLGSNGVGKTTMLKVISGLLKPSSGKVFFRDEEITGISPDQLCAKGLVIIPEERNLLPPCRCMKI